jgi:gliding motility-associated-like protein
MHRILTILTFVFALSCSAGLAQSGSQGDAIGAQVEEDGGLYIPNAFTPNQDGVNDEFYLTNANFSKFTFAVFDRWGNQMYTTADPNFRWNGERNGNPIASGTYVFVIEGTSTKGISVKRSGTISVMR